MTHVPLYCDTDGVFNKCPDRWYTTSNRRAFVRPNEPFNFVAPSTSTHNSVIIEFCDRCRWLHRATWTSTELFLTFPPPTIRSITIIPLNSEDTAGRFRVWLTVD
ncbi:hypothetical protein EDB89DRAFT_533821 [Lactarius sanguifluus]|nr:hypothetical protein EDB89DRAFT_533821 [Lactarius sanguifluus]